jgi:hypothetical protein
MRNIAMHEPVLRLVHELRAKFPGRRVAPSLSNSAGISAFCIPTARGASASNY